ncbi:DNA helicase/exodeoxyribonuclease V, subunit A [Anaerosporobacter mobilis DSM 15930]|uniref:ATP-dependent helicase/nuclease subunit A n=1 Tax=Anaerosporobacter mobilis DSM 15930 TaxID=1120996 RepID=A0A1M7LG71_9FIRM|nr:UvrD-helicase domain-containing protein [Anaerosporobacter mobilis]SHM76440.1 DNA helicase/exodeoxyribonuclease V, subunit A [Anaerosporobacter mobilis DSM 15930]
MAEVAWTSDQQKVIDLRDRNILVSAAAGSGKTAVLVERIIKMISEGENPVDVDKLLIVTFTNAAAAEMRERILQAIEKKLDSMPDNKHLQKQMMLIHSAQITTIHSFCLNVIRNHFNVIDLDPSFRIADEAELTLLRADVIEELLEDRYEKAEEDFTTFVECYASGKTDTALEELILQLYHFSMSYPWPMDWLESQKKSFRLESVDSLQETEWMKGLLNYIKSMTGDLMCRNEQARELANGIGGPYMYDEALQEDHLVIRQLMEAESYHQYSEVLESLKWKALSRKKDEDVDPTKREQVKAIRDEVKKAVVDIKKNYFYQPEEEMLTDLQKVAPVMKVLIDLTVEFAERYAGAKEEKNLVDFNDLEHFALNILVKKEEGVVVPSNVADDLSEYYEEILIDEYQDSNLVQETILTSISKERLGRNNLFMVGDVKQSIYKFRLARPELFMEKFHTYSLEEGAKQRIDLHANFRSRAVVLACTNYIFEQIMTKQLGNIDYDDDAALNPGAVFEPCDDRISTTTEVLLVTDEEFDKQEELLASADKKQSSESESGIEYNDGKTEGKKETKIEKTELDKEQEEYTARELEARAIGLRIKELIQPETGLKVWNKEKKCYETARYRDIVILLRTMSGWSQTFADTLMSMGIPAFSDTQSGYFSTIEIRTILNMLRVIDNPRQDIPLTAVLHSKMVGLTSTDLAIIRGVKDDCDMYDAVKHYAQRYQAVVDNKSAKDSGNDPYKDVDKDANKEIETEFINDNECGTTEKNLKAASYIVETSELDNQINEEIGSKLILFFKRLENYRECLAYTPIHELIWLVIRDTGYYNYVSAMPAGDRRKANIDMLIERAVQYEATSYHGLFQFVRYIEKLHKYDIDFGEAVTVGEGENTVRIMSIHKSKGLEFPVVFVAGMSKVFNNQDARSKLVIHPDLGIGPDYVDPDLRIKSPTLLKKFIQKRIVLENLGEELRVLYVALTRAKEKLILTGYVPSVGDKLKKWSDTKDQTNRSLLFQKLAGAGNYFDWVMPSLVRHKDCNSLLQQYNILPGVNLEPNKERDVEANFEIKTIDVLRTVEEEVARQLVNTDKKQQLLQWDAEQVYDESIRESIHEHLGFEYPFANEVKLHAKITVSELKKLGQMIDDEESMQLFNSNDSKLVGELSLLQETSQIHDRMEEPIPFEYQETDKEEVNQLENPLENQIEDIDNELLPRFMLESVPVQGARRGTVYHKVLECIPILDEPTVTKIQEATRQLVEKTILTEEEAEVVNPYQIVAFMKSDIAKRMERAGKQGKIHREQQFVFSMKAKEIRPDFMSEEPILVQGIIDCFFEEHGQIVIVDYKTDHIPKESGEEILRSRYKVQLDYYQRAIEQTTGKKVSQRILYSFALQREVEV